MKNQKKKQVKDRERAALSGWEEEGGAAPPDPGRLAETERQGTGERGRRAALDATHDSSARGEHRYPDAHQTEAEQRARQSRDDLKRKFRRTP